MITLDPPEGIFNSPPPLRQWTSKGWVRIEPVPEGVRAPNPLCPTQDELDELDEDAQG